MNKVLGFAPDSDPTTPGLLTDCANLIPSELGMRPGPTVTPIALTRPGIGQSRNLPVSAATFSGISAASSASRCV